MSRIRLRQVHQFRDRHGKLRHSFRRGTAKKVSLPGLPGSAEFMAAYKAALAVAEASPSKPIGLEHSPPGSMSALIAAPLSGCQVSDGGQGGGRPSRPPADKVRSRPFSRTRTGAEADGISTDNSPS